MIRKTSILLHSIIFSVFFIGCTTPKTLVLDIQKPAEITLPESINSVVIVNNFVNQPSNYGHRTITYDKKGNKQIENIKINTDSLDFIFSETIFKTLSDIDYFNTISIYDQSLRNDISFGRIQPLNQTDIEEISNLTNSDAVISLNRFVIVSELEEKSYQESVKVTEKILKGEMLANFCVYNQKGDLISTPVIALSDSIFWSSSYINNTLASDYDLPTRDDAIKECAKYAGEKIAKSLTPQWSKELRAYYNENKNALKLFEDGKYSDAIQIWTYNFNEETNEKKKARLAFNIALANELSDNIEESLEWINKSVDLFKLTQKTSIDTNHYTRAFYYKERLEERFNELKMLNSKNQN